MILLISESIYSCLLLIDLSLSSLPSFSNAFILLDSLLLYFFSTNLIESLIAFLFKVPLLFYHT